MYIPYPYICTFAVCIDFKVIDCKAHPSNPVPLVSTKPHLVPPVEGNFL